MNLDNIKVDLIKRHGSSWYGFIWLRIRSSCRLFYTR